MQKLLNLILATALIVIFSAAFGLAEDSKTSESNLELSSQLPKDPLVAWDVSVGNGGELWDSLITMVQKFVPDEELQEFEEGLANIDRELGFSLRDDFLAHLGPEFAGAVDVPPIDAAVGSIMAGTPEGITSVVERIGLWMQVTDADKVDAALRAMFAKAEATLSNADGLVQVHFGPTTPPPEDVPPEPQFDLYYGLKNGVLSIGFSSDAVRARLAPLENGQQLADGGDFAAVMSHLDANPTGLYYFNLPRLQRLIAESQMIQGMMSADPELKPVLDLMLDPALATSGLGATSLAVGGGVRQSTFGPKWVGGGMTTTGIVASIAIPNLLNAINVGRTKRTMADLRTVATAIEMFAVDNNTYPQTDGWVDVASLTDDLAPDYITTLPGLDGWSNPMLYSSDGEHYRLVSPGKDGVFDQESENDVDSTQGFEKDIVFADGDFVTDPLEGQ